MGNPSHIKWLNDTMKSLNVSENEKADVFFNFFINIFYKKYGIKAFDMDEEMFNRSSNVYNFNYDSICFEHIDCSVFSIEYEKYLSSKNRYKTGSFYTPYYIVEYMVQKSILYYISSELEFSEEVLWDYFNKKKNLEKEQLKKILNVLDEVKIIDTACGTGIFLIECLKKLYNYKQKIYIQLNKRIDDFILKKEIIEKNIFGMDIQKKAVIIAKMSLFSFAYKNDVMNYGKKINNNIIVGDSLADTIFSENILLKKIIVDQGGFDIVIGNPPYLGEKGNKDIFDKVKNTKFGQLFYEGKMDYFYFFMYRGIEILKKKGVMGYITTNYFVTADGACNLRKFLKNNVSFIEILNFNEYEVFKSAKGQHNLIFFSRKEVNEKQVVDVCYLKDKKVDFKENIKVLYKNEKKIQDIVRYKLLNQASLYSEDGHILIQGNHMNNSILEKMCTYRQCTLGELFFINQGLVSGADKVTNSILQNKFSQDEILKNDIRLNQGIFILTKDEVNKLGIEKTDYLKPLFKNSDIKRYYTKNNFNKYILYISNKIGTKTRNDSIITEHLSRYKEVLQNRREIIRGIRPWYALQWPRTKRIFENIKIIVPYRSKQNRFAREDGPWYASADVYFITSKKPNTNLNFILAQLNSKLMYYWLYYLGKRKGNFLELYANPLRKLPIICDVDQNIKKEIDALVNKIINQGENYYLQESIDKIIYRMYSCTREEIEIIENLYKQSF